MAKKDLSINLDHDQLLLLCQALQAEIDQHHQLSPLRLQKIVRRYPKTFSDAEPFFSKSEILQFYLQQTPTEQRHQTLLDALMVKPTRTQSGVATITILTKPYPCPGQCIFCPADIRMPKSYLNQEPGAQRAETNYFDPYLQTTSRLINLIQMGHELDKIELIILGGTWTAYPADYQRWFITEALRALNEFQPAQFNQSTYQAKLDQQRRQREQVYLDYQARVKSFDDQPVLSNDKQANATAFAAPQAQLSTGQEKYNQLVSQLYLQPEKEFGLAAFQTADWHQLELQQQHNETAACRNVGLVVETRPDEISVPVLVDLRHLGCTKIQLGVQSVNDDLLEKNHRGTTTKQIARAFALLRLFGFKIHAHFMANLYGATPELDAADFQEFFTNPAYLPDELKMYPCSLIESAPLYDYYQDGRWQPYTEVQLLKLLVSNLLNTPAYCRVTRMIRDISSSDIVVGNKKTNFRQLVDQEIARQGGTIQEIRSREIRRQEFDPAELKLHHLTYETLVSQEIFLEFITPTNQIAGFLRLSLPIAAARDDLLTDPEKQLFPTELLNSAIIREIHVYGQVAKVGERGQEQHKAQHLGLGSQLITAARKIAAQAGYQQLAVISALGTREYYRHQGFTDGKLYQCLTLS